MYIKLFNEFSQKNSKYHLTVEELYIYSLLKRRMDFSHVTVTTIDLIIELSSKYNNIKIHSKKSEARKRVVNYLRSLENKGVIEVNGDYEKYNNIIEISFVQLKDGFVEVEFEIFDNIDCMINLYIYFVVAKYNNKNNNYKTPFNCSDEQWMDILQIKSKETVRNYINQAVKNGLIYKNTGDYTDIIVRQGQKGQEVSQYKLVPFVGDEKTNMQRKKEYENNANINRSNKQDEKLNHEYPFDTGNWMKSKSILTENDYVIYLKHKQKDDVLSRQFIDECNKRRDLLDKNGKYKQYVEKHLIEKAKKIIEKEKNEKLMEDAKDIIAKTNDVALIVDGEAISYEEWNGIDQVERIYYLYFEQAPTPEGFIEEIDFRDVYDNSEIEWVRNKHVKR